MCAQAHAFSFDESAPDLSLVGCQHVSARLVSAPGQRFAFKECEISTNNNRIAKGYETAEGHVRLFANSTAKKQEKTSLPIGRPHRLTDDQEMEVIALILAAANDRVFLTKWPVLDEVDPSMFRAGRNYDRMCQSSPPSRSQPRDSARISRPTFRCCATTHRRRQSMTRLQY
jgi:hypothetical protein